MNLPSFEEPQTGLSKCFHLCGLPFVTGSVHTRLDGSLLSSFSMGGKDRYSDSAYNSRIHPLQLQPLWRKFGPNVIVVFYVWWDEHGNWTPTHEHFNVVPLCRNTHTHTHIERIKNTICTLLEVIFPRDLVWMTISYNYYRIINYYFLLREAWLWTNGLRKHPCENLIVIEKTNTKACNLFGNKSLYDNKIHPDSFVSPQLRGQKQSWH